MTVKRRKKPETVRDMARRRGLSIFKAKRAGWYVTLYQGSDVLRLWASDILYCTHEWRMIVKFVKLRKPILKVGDT